ncbi:BF3164 family lipoprotein [Segatella oris]|uniref:BF3164 family lipoprotein n=1 Tax=Segatella oris TaxID=28135 RepID=UPI00311A1D22
MKYTRILFPVLCLFVCSCRRSHNIQDYYSLQKKKSFILETKTDVDMTELNDILYIYDYYAPDSLLTLISGKTGKEIRKMIPRGQGGGDSLRNINYMECNAQQNSLLVYDINQGKLLEYTLPYPYKQQQGEIDYSVKLCLNSDKIYSLNKIKDGYIATGVFDKHKFRILNKDLNQIIGSYGEYCKKPSNNIPDKIHAKANFGKSVYNTSDSLLVNIVYISGEITFYKYKNHSLHLLRDYVLAPMNYTVQNGNYKNEGKMGFLSLSVTHKFVFALYSGKEEDNSINMQGDYIFQFNHRGELLRKYKLDEPSIAIAANNKGTLYSLVSGNKSKINVYESITH